MKRFHPLVEEWFTTRFREPTEPQSRGWEHIASGTDTLIAAPTGSGKTFAAFLWWINDLVEAASNGYLTDSTSVVYVSPLKALGNDIRHNLQEPLDGICELASSRGVELPGIRVMVRSGDTPASERNLMVRHPPHILVTTPESLYILLTAERSRAFLAGARAVIVDEIHAVAGDKRGAHLALSLERLDLLAGRRLQRIGLSATQKPIEEIARLLVGTERMNPTGEPDCAIVDVGHRRDWDLKVWVPDVPLGPIATNELRDAVIDRMAKLATQHHSTLVFVNTRRLAERVAHELTERLGEGKVAAHHGSLSKKIRLRAEQGLKSGAIPVVVATASLELGIDIGHVDLVCHVGAPRTLATLLQRIGRSGHFLGGTSKGVILPMTRDELVQSAAGVRAANAGELDRVIMPAKPLDILAQQMVATAASGEIPEEEMWLMARRAYPYRELERREFNDVLKMLADGVATRHGRRSSHIHRDRINGVLRGRRGARLAAITSGGAIPDVGDFDVVLEPDETFIGRVNEDFAIESMAGDIFLLGNSSWRIRRIESGKVRVEDAHGLPPTVPFWTGEAPARTIELSSAVADLREAVAAGLDNRRETENMLMAECGLDQPGAGQVFDYIVEIVSVLGCVPTQRRVVAERFFDEAGGMQLVLHAPFGARVNRAWGLALRKRFCVTFDFELQAAATDDGVVLSLGEQHSFPLDSTFNFVRTPVLEESLVQAALASPMFGNRWRWNATRALALLRHTGGRRVPFPILRMRSDDLLSAVFPDQVACQEERMGPITPPDHPLVTETLRNCLHEAMDLETTKVVIGKVERGEIETVAVETPAPSAASAEILNANPYAFLDDAPLEERRARAVSLRRTDPGLARQGLLDAAAIEDVVASAAPDVRDADELHDLLLSVTLLPLARASQWDAFALELIKSGRATIARFGELSAYVAAERTPHLEALLTGVAFAPPLVLPDHLRPELVDDEEILREVTQGWMQIAGPVTIPALSSNLGLDAGDIERAMLSLESAGMVLRGSFTPGASETEWCDRRLLARIHRLTLTKLRKEIEAVSPATFMRFLLRWQHLHPGTHLHGREGLIEIIGKLEGFEASAPQWESNIFPGRVAGYRPEDLEYLCLSGAVAWGRPAPGKDGEEPPGGRRQGLGRSTPITFVLREDLAGIMAPREGPAGAVNLSGAARDVATFLDAHGASFMSDISRGTSRLPGEVERALWELVAGGLVTGDGVAGLRKLLGARHEEQRRRRLRAVGGSRGAARDLPVGRWSLWQIDADASADERLEAAARRLARRYGVVFRELISREKSAPSWRALLGVYRRLEARAEMRGGRFVKGFVGEQFAVPGAVEGLRAVRKAAPDSVPVVVAAADPANLTGVMPGEGRVPSNSGDFIAYRDGVAVDSGPLGDLRSRLRAAGAG